MTDTSEVLAEADAAGIVTPENVRSLTILLELAAQRSWLTGDQVGLNKDSCILSTRIVLEVCRYFGLKAKPLAVSTAVFNPEGFRQYRAWHALPPEERGPSSIEDPGWAVGIEGDDLDVLTPRDGAIGGRWNGHLIAEVEGFFFDYTIDQFSRPDKGMDVDTPLLMPVQQNWHDYGVAVYQRADGVGIVYRTMGPAKGYTRASDWNRSKNWHRQITGELINRVKENL